MIVVSDVIRHCCNLRFQRRPLLELKRESLVQLRQSPVWGFDRPVMLGQSFKQIPGQIETVMAGIRAFNPHDRAQRLRIVVKSAVALHRFAQSIFACMSKRRVAQIMRQTQCFSQVFIKSKTARDHPPDLRDLKTMRQPRAIMIALW